MSIDPIGERTFEVAEKVAGILEAENVPTALIGAVAAGFHHYPRATYDLDLACATNPFGELSKAERRLRGEGLDAELVTPDAQDSLGGVINICGDDFDKIQVVNFWNPWNATNNPGAEAVRTAIDVPNRRLRVVDLPHLIALKLYGTGTKNRLDVLELIRRNHPLDLAALRAVCGRFDLGPALEAVLAEFEDLVGK